MSVTPLLDEPRVEATGMDSRVLWRMKGKRRVISATLCEFPDGHHLVVAFEDNPNDVIETQFEAAEVRALVDRANALREILHRKGLTELPVPQA